MWYNLKLGSLRLRSFGCWRRARLQSAELASGRAGCCLIGHQPSGGAAMHCTGSRLEGHLQHRRHLLLDAAHGLRLPGHSVCKLEKHRDAESRQHRRLSCCCR
jgi:hypothetical protein